MVICGKPVVQSTNNDALFNDQSNPALKKRFYRVLMEPN